MWNGLCVVYTRDEHHGILYIQQQQQQQQQQNIKHGKLL